MGYYEYRGEPRYIQEEGDDENGERRPSPPRRRTKSPTKEDASGGGGGFVVVAAVVAALVAWSSPSEDAPQVAETPTASVSFECGQNVKVISGPTPIQVVKNTTWTFLKQVGLTDNQSAGTMGNLQAESGFDPAVVEREPNAYGTRGIGLAQWTGERRHAIEAEAVRCRKSVADLPFQLYYLHKELQDRSITLPAQYGRFKNQWDALTHQNLLEDALVAFHHEFEKSKYMDLGHPAAAQAVIWNRRPFALQILDEYT